MDPQTVLPVYDPVCPAVHPLPTEALAAVGDPGEVKIVIDLEQ